MVLPKSALGAQAAALKRNPRSGVLSNAQTAAGQLDPRVTTVSLTRGGRLNGSALAFRASLSRTETALARGTGLLGIGSDVDVFRDSAAAAGQMARSLGDLRALTGKRLRGGALLVRGAEFRVPRIADASHGMALTARIEGFDLHVTQVAFRRGRLLAGAFEIRAGSGNANAAVDSLARRLDGRIERVLAKGGGRT